MARKPKTLYLVDGSNYIFRAFYAIRGLSTSKGFPTNALYGFTQMLLKLLRDENPDHIAVVFDTPEPTFRDEMYEDYKSNRAAPPDELLEQLPYVIPIVKALGLAVCELPGYEADDLIGTIARRFASKDLKVVVVSGDKDLMQLLDDNISLLDTMKEARFTSKEVRQRFGVDPDRLIDVLGLAGDATDNVPGLPGVGLKTASKLIEQYGSLEDLIAHADELAPGLRDKLREHLDQVRLSRKLVTIKTDVDMDVGLDDMRRSEAQSKELHRLFSELEFTKLLAELAPRKAGAANYRIVDDARALERTCDAIRSAGVVAIALEASSPRAMQASPVGLAVAWAAGEAAYLPIGHCLGLGERQLDERVILDALTPLLRDDAIRVVAHDAKFVQEVLIGHGVEIRGLVCDTMIAGYLVDPAGQSSLDILSSRYLDHDLPLLDDVLGKGVKRRRFADLNLKRACDVAAERADVCLQLSDVLMKLLAEEGLDGLYGDLELPLIDVLRSMEMTGVRIDRSRLAELSQDFTGRLRNMEVEIFEEAGEEFNINSPRQLGRILFEKLKLPGAKKTKTGYSTSQEILEELAASFRLPELVLSYRQLAKLKSTYVDALPQLIDPTTGRIHTTFNQAVAATGRLSSSDPNLQNIPIRRAEGRSIRRAFVPDEGYVFIDADYSQIELRVLAHLTKDPELLDAFNKGVDVHAVTASGIFGVPPADVREEQRAVGKTVNFATIYGQTEFGLARQLKIEVDAAASYIKGYFATYPGVRAYRDEVLTSAREKGYVETLFGRRRYLPDIKSSNGMLRALAERMAFNTVFQGTAADIIKRAMLVIHRDLGRMSAGARMILQVHDELLFEVPHGDAERVKAFVKEEMESAADLAVPVVVDVGVGSNWADAH